MMIRSTARALVLLGAAAALAACGRDAAEATASGNETAAEAAASNQADGAAPAAAPGAPTATPAAAGAVTAEYMLGKWSAIDEDCSETLEFRKDGTVVTPIGEAKWTLVGDQLTFDYGDGSKQPSSRIKALSADRIEITRASGGTETERRC